MPWPERRLTTVKWLDSRSALDVVPRPRDGVVRMETARASAEARVQEAFRSAQHFEPVHPVTHAVSHFGYDDVLHRLRVASQCLDHALGLFAPYAHIARALHDQHRPLERLCM